MTTTTQPRQVQSATLMALIIVLLSLSLPLSASATTGDTAAFSIKATSRATSLALVADYCTWSVESPHVTFNKSGTKIVNEKSRITCNTSRIYKVKMRMQMQVYGPDGKWHTYSSPDVTHPEFKPYPGTEYTRYASRTCNIYGLNLRNRTTFTVSHTVYGTFSKVVYSAKNYVKC